MVFQEKIIMAYEWKEFFYSRIFFFGLIENMKEREII